MGMKKSKLSGLLVPVSVLAAMAIGVTCATVLHTLTLENPIKTPTVTSEIVETSSKEVSFKNTGEADVFLRASFSGSWLYTKDQGETSAVMSNEAATRGGGTVSAAEPTILASTDYTQNWIDGGDGWYYYKYILRGSANGTGNNSTSKLIDGVSFANLDSYDIVDARYKASDSNASSYSDYQIHVVTEVVQASDEIEVSKDAVKKLFNRDIALSNFAVSPLADGREVISSDKYTTPIDWLGQ